MKVKEEEILEREEEIHEEYKKLHPDLFKDFPECYTELWYEVDEDNYVFDAEIIVNTQEGTFVQAEEIIDQDYKLREKWSQYFTKERRRKDDPDCKAKVEFREELPSKGKCSCHN